MFYYPLASIPVVEFLEFRFGGVEDGKDASNNLVDNFWRFFVTLEFGVSLGVQVRHIFAQLHKHEPKKCLNTVFTLVNSRHIINNSHYIISKAE